MKSKYIRVDLGNNTFVYKHVGIYGDDNIISESSCPRFLCSVYFHIKEKLSIKFKIFSRPLSLHLYFFLIQLCDIICILLMETVILNLSSVIKTFRLGYQGMSSEPEMIVMTDFFQVLTMLKSH